MGLKGNRRSKRDKILLEVIDRLNKKQEAFKLVHDAVGRLPGLKEVDQFYNWLETLDDSLSTATNEVICMLDRL